MESQISVTIFYALPAIGMLIASILLILFFKKPFTSIIGTFSPRQTILNGIIIFCQLLLVSLFIDLFTKSMGINDTQLVEQTISTLRTFNTETIATIIGNVAIEELFFRGIIYTWLGSAVSILLFGLFHTGYQSWIQLAASLAAGYILIRSREQNQSIFPGIIGHALYNLVIIFILSS
ncbi:MAG: CPBP family intramembrane metalloprotease [Candidatus Diapherotrites archaeon]|uniref:CPBP family intramembrane metalloprotease n=1 Tax=Candidatus Iainarchaeum sp. TaxID=3101447 RepID=A0A8T4C9R0_9ARCH|nr:CPBP family intramembrane metalloprotease [Candidatus Diapherotrites archaeon]